MWPWPNSIPRVFHWTLHRCGELTHHKDDMPITWALSERLKEHVSDVRYRQVLMDNILRRRVDLWWEQPTRQTHIFLWTGSWEFYRAQQTIALHGWHERRLDLLTGKLRILSSDQAMGFYARRLRRRFKRLRVDTNWKGYHWYDAYPHPISEGVYKTDFNKGEVGVSCLDW